MTGPTPPSEQESLQRIQGISEEEQELPEQKKIKTKKIKDGTDDQQPLDRQEIAYNLDDVQQQEMEDVTWVTEQQLKEAVYETGDEDIENKGSKVSCYTRKMEVADVESMLEGLTWRAMKRFVVLVHYWRTKKEQEVPTSALETVTPDAMTAAEIQIVKLCQRHYFSQELKNFPVNSFRKSSPLRNLNCFVAEDTDLIRLGGRTRRSAVVEMEKYPIILPACPIASAIIKYCHDKVLHQGRTLTTGRLRREGYWVINSQNLIKDEIKNCVICLKHRGRLAFQKMADLPEARVTPTPPFTEVSIDPFGPFMVTQGRSRAKRYGLMITCMYTRGVHIELLYHLTTDSLIIGLRSFMGMRGPVRRIYSDQGTNLMGARTEMKRFYDLVLDPRLKMFLDQNDCVAEWCFQAPHASHTGGVHERMIGIARNILEVMFGRQRVANDDEMLRCMFSETSGIMNSRPLALGHQVEDEETLLLTPNMVITGKSRVLCPMTTEQDVADYTRKRWTEVQTQLDAFWRRFSQEYMETLQTRRKWQTAQRSLEKGDVVMVRDRQLCRNDWSLGRVDEVIPSLDGHVRKCMIRMTTPLDDKGIPIKKVSMLERNVQDLVLILQKEEEKEVKQGKKEESVTEMQILK